MVLGGQSLASKVAIAMPKWVKIISSVGGINKGVSEPTLH